MSRTRSGKSSTSLWSTHISNSWTPPETSQPRSGSSRSTLVLESTLGLTSFKFITDYLSANQLLPGFVDGYSKIHRDETRHIGYGVWYLRETIRQHPDAGDIVRTTLRDLLPAVAESLKPPGDGAAESVLGVSEDDLRQFALAGLTRRLSIIGVPIDTL